MPQRTTHHELEFRYLLNDIDAGGSSVDSYGFAERRSVRVVPTGHRRGGRHAKRGGRTSVVPARRPSHRPRHAARRSDSVAGERGSIIPLMTAMVLIAIAAPLTLFLLRTPQPAPADRPQAPQPAPRSATPLTSVAVVLPPPPQPEFPSVPAPPSSEPAAAVAPVSEAPRADPAPARKPEVGVTRTPVTRTPISAVPPSPPPTGRNSSTPGDEPHRRRFGLF